jgi:benzoate-CoA ligase
LVPGYEARIVDEKGMDVSGKGEGILMIKGDSQGLGYWQAHQKSRRTFQGPWLNTGDLFRRDENGYYWYVGRDGALLKVGGIFVAPLEIENCLLGHPAVREAAVIGFPDEQGLIKPKAFVVVQSGTEASAQLAVELQQFVKNNLAPYKYPRWVTFLTRLPKNRNNKIDTRALKEIQD